MTYYPETTRSVYGIDPACKPDLLMQAPFCPLARTQIGGILPHRSTDQ